MSRPGLRSGNTGIAPSDHERHSEHEEETPVASAHPPNPGPMPGLTAEQADSLQAFVAASNKVKLDGPNESVSL